MFRDDYIERLIDQIATLLADMAGFQRSGDDRGVLDEADRGYAMLLGPQRQFLDMVDGASLASLMGGDPRRTRALAQVVHREAKARESLGDTGKARRRYQQALALYGKAGEAREPEDDAAMDEIRLWLGRAS